MAKHILKNMPCLCSTSNCPAFVDNKHSSGIFECWQRPTCGGRSCHGCASNQGRAVQTSLELQAQAGKPCASLRLWTSLLHIQFCIRHMANSSSCLQWITSPSGVIVAMKKMSVTKRGSNSLPLHHKGRSIPSEQYSRTMCKVSSC